MWLQGSSFGTLGLYGLGLGLPGDSGFKASGVRLLLSMVRVVSWCLIKRDLLGFFFPLHVAEVCFVADSCMERMCALTFVLRTPNGAELI